MKKILIFLIILFSVFSCNKKTEKTKVNEVSMIEEWFPSACFAGDMFAMNTSEKQYGIKIKVSPGAEDVDPVKLVIAGTFDFGIAGGDRVLLANKNGANLVVLGAVNYKSPTCFISLKKNNIITPKDFENRIVGVMTGNNTEYVYRSLINKANLNIKKKDEVEAPFDLATFISGVYDIRPAFVYDEPVSLDAKGIAYNIVKPEDYGVNFIGPVIFCKKDFVNNNRELVQKYVNTMCSGWENALKNPKLAISYLKKYDKNIDESRELKSLLKGKEYFSGENGKPLYISKQKWNQFVDELVTLNKISINSKNAECFDNSFIVNYYKK